MKIRLLFSFSFIFLLSYLIKGQDKTALLTNLSLEDAIQYGLNHSADINIQKLKREETKLNLTKTKLDRLPDIYASADAKRNIVIPSTPIPAEIFGNNNPGDQFRYMKFNTRWNSSAGINVSFDLFNPDKIGTSSLKNKELKVNEYDIILSKKELELNISKAYLDYAISQEQLKYTSQDTAWYGALLEESNRRYKKGSISLVERNNSQSAYNESMLRFNDAERILSQAKINLLFFMGIIITKENITIVNIKDSIPSLYHRMAQSTIIDYEQTGIEEIRQKELIAVAHQKTYMSARKYLPTLSLNGYYGSSFYATHLNQISKNDFWRGYSYIGLSLRIPMMSALKTNNEVSVLRLQEQMEQEKLRTISQNRNKELALATTLLETKQKEFLFRKQNLELEQQNIKAAEQQFNKGYILQADFLKGKAKMQKITQEYLQSAYDILSCYITIEMLESVSNTNKTATLEQQQP